MGWSLQKIDRGSQEFMNYLIVHKRRTVPNALFLLFVCFKVWEALAAQVFLIPAVTTSPLKIVRRQRC